MIQLAICADLKALFAHRWLKPMQSRVSYPVGKGNTSMLKTLTERFFSGLFDMLGRIVCLKPTSWYSGNSSSQHYTGNLQAAPICIRKKGTRCASWKCRRRTWVYSSTWNMLPSTCCCGRQPTSSVLQMFHLRIWLRYRNGRTCPSFDSGPPGPPFLINVFSWRRCAES